MYFNLKCRKCRTLLINTNEIQLLDQHGNILKSINNSVTYDCGDIVLNAWYFDDNKLPAWITKEINQADWQKGKLRCPHCHANIGSFDFIYGSKCSCSLTVKPSIQFIKSKLDVSIKQF